MKKRPIKHFQRIIEDTNWDNELIEQEDKMNAACWLLVVIAVIFFAVILSGIIIR